MSLKDTNPTLSIRAGDRVRYKYTYRTKDGENNWVERTKEGVKTANITGPHSVTFIETTKEGTRHLTLDLVSGEVYADYPHLMSGRRYVGILEEAQPITSHGP